MGYFKHSKKRDGKKYCVTRQYRKKNPVAHIRSYASKSQVVDAYDLVYRQMLRQQNMGNAAAAEQLERLLNEFGKTVREDDTQCVQLSESCFDGSVRKRWVRIKKINCVKKANCGTYIGFVNGGEMYVAETVDRVMKLIRER